MKKSNLITISILFGVAILTLIGKINDILDFYEKTKNMNWINIISTVANLLLIVALCYYAYHVNNISDFFKNNEIELKDYKSLTKQNKEIIQRNEELIKIMEFEKEYSRICSAVIFDNIKDVCNDVKDVKKIAKALLLFYKERGITIPDWEKFRLPIEITDEMKLIYYEEKSKEIKEK